jgi:hypothetical protein
MRLDTITGRGSPAVASLRGGDPCARSPQRRDAHASPSSRAPVPRRLRCVIGTLREADLRSPFPQEPLRFLRIQAVRDLAKVDEAGRASGRTSGVPEDLQARVAIERQTPAGRVDDE